MFVKKVRGVRVIDLAEFEVYLGKPKDGERQVGLGRQVVKRLTLKLIQSYLL